MPDIANGREKVNAFLKDKGIKKTTLAVAYGFKRQEVTNILSGTTKGPRANSFILQVIEDYGIEQEEENETKTISVQWEKKKAYRTIDRLYNRSKRYSSVSFSNFPIETPNI